MFDTVCKFLAETFPQDFAQWLLGEAIDLTELSPSELSLEPIRADAVIYFLRLEWVNNRFDSLFPPFASDPPQP